ncbi:glycosyltransferase family 4 protein [Costertonia aggregata]|uniref:Glycosyltransferase family 4 protein n=2 Tax=Costertonia aggregata TaxID=343403 RepID=A0A7H9AV56_9FLAO|nr:glycosyltransferase family 4 protein [Costertonia aggregata]
MNQHYEVIGISSGGKGLEKVHTQEEIKVIPVEMTRKITPIKDIKAVIQLYRIFKNEKPFIVHSHTPKAGTVAMLAAKLAGVRFRLHTIAGLPLVEAKGLKRVLLNTVEKITYGCASMIYPNSQGLKDIILNNGFTSEKKLKIIGEGSSNGINTSHFDPALFNEEDKAKLKGSLGINENHIVFTFVGRLVKDKGINELIEAFQRISGTYDNVKLLLVGKYEKLLDPLLPETEKHIDTNPNILSVGWQTDVRPYFAITDALVFPSYREGFPNVVMQAGAMKVYSIVTNINGCNEIIVEGENGTIIETKSAKALYDKMKLFCENALIYDADKCRQLIVSRYEQHYIWSEILKVYQTLENSVKRS